jgi:hypothetical protein
MWKASTKIKSSSSDTKKKSKTKRSLKMNCYISARQASDYDALTEFLINSIKQEYELGSCIITIFIEQQPIDTEIWKSKLKNSQNPDPETKETENAQFTIKFKAYFD